MGGRGRGVSQLARSTLLSGSRSSPCIELTLPVRSAACAYFLDCPLAEKHRTRVIDPPTESNNQARLAGFLVGLGSDRG